MVLSLDGFSTLATNEKDKNEFGSPYENRGVVVHSSQRSIFWIHGHGASKCQIFMQSNTKFSNIRDRGYNQNAFVTWSNCSFSVTGGIKGIEKSAMLLSIRRFLGRNRSIGLYKTMDTNLLGKSKKLASISKRGFYFSI